MSQIDETKSMVFFAALFFVVVSIIEVFSGKFPSLPGMGGALVLSFITAMSFYAQRVQHGSQESFDPKKLLTTVLVAVTLGGLTGQTVTDQQLSAALGGGLGTNIALIIESLSKAMTKKK